MNDVDLCWVQFCPGTLNNAHPSRVCGARQLGCMALHQNEDPYDLLLVSRSATAAEIRRSYQELARKVRNLEPS